MKLYDDIGKMALGSRVRFLGEKIGAEATEIYKEYGTNLQPKWFPVFYVLSQNSENSVTSIADKIGHSHVSVIKILSEMTKVGLITEKTDTQDRRRTLINLSKKGQNIAVKIESQYKDVTAAIEEISMEAKNDLWAALQEWEQLLEQKSLSQRVFSKKKQREMGSVRIVDYRPQYQEAFRKLNEEWINKYFKMEKPDHEALGNPKKYILDGGGHIFVALLNEEAVGVCAIMKREEIDAFELVKMAVAPKAQGKNIGFLLGQACIEKAKEIQAKRLFLESNTVLVPAIQLYRKLGFEEIKGPPTPYARCNIQMELKFKKSQVSK